MPRMRSVLTILLIARSVTADPAVHKFELWGSEAAHADKLSLYWGWANGFFDGRGAAGLRLADCLEKISYSQAVAVIDRRYKDHPESWSRPLGEQILRSLTESDGPCPGMNPFVSN